MEKCAICGNTDELVIHHMKPLSKGGQDIPENRVLLCKKCHNGRHSTKAGTGSQGSYSFRINKTMVGTFYIGGLEETWQSFREICQREGTTASKKLREFFSNYVETHALGNPQQRLDTQLKLQRPYRAYACFVVGCQRKASFMFIQKGIQNFACKHHWKTRKPKDIEGFRGLEDGSN